MKADFPQKMLIDPICPGLIKASKMQTHFAIVTSLAGINIKEMIEQESKNT